MSVRFLILGLDEPLRRQVKGDLQIAYPNAEVEMEPLPEDSAHNAELAAYTALFIGYEHGREERDGKLARPRCAAARVQGLRRADPDSGARRQRNDCRRCGARGSSGLPAGAPDLPATARRTCKGSLANTWCATSRAPPVAGAPAAAPSELPTTVSGYQVLQTLARSDRSAVYLARSEELGFNVALKVLRRAADVADAPGDEQRFAREYKIISQIRHRAIVDVYDFGSTEGLSYIATEYFPAGDLKTRLQNPMSTDEATDYAKQIAEALRIIHVAGVLHRDLKPANVMLRTDNSLVLIDFGLAKELTGDKALTGAGEIRGSPYYMSPEQADGRPVDERSDLYSLGVIFYELLTGTRPFQGRTVFDILAQHQHAPIPQLSGAAARVQPLLDRLLAKAPADRFQSATDFLTALRPKGPPK